MSSDKKTDARKLDHATLEAMRLRAVAAAKAGMKATDLAQAYGVNRRTVFRWLADFYEGGEPALKAKPIPGRPAKLDESQMRWADPAGARLQGRALDAVGRQPQRRIPLHAA